MSLSSSLTLCTQNQSYQSLPAGPMSIRSVEWYKAWIKKKKKSFRFCVHFLCVCVFLESEWVSVWVHRFVFFMQYMCFFIRVVYLYVCGHKHVSGTQKLKVWWSPPAAAAAAVRVRHTLFPDHDALGLNRADSDSWEQSMEKDNLSQTHTGCSVEPYPGGWVERGWHSF